ERPVRAGCTSRAAPALAAAAPGSAGIPAHPRRRVRVRPAAAARRLGADRCRLPVVRVPPPRLGSRSRRPRHGGPGVDPPGRRRRPRARGGRAV
ncbi:MAG: hypothetical protein AVDCRST_MAG20-74, partial [uncultured Acidimicrobiales bacterium]